MALIALLATSIPTAIYFWIAAFLGRPNAERRPWWLLPAIFLWGAVPSLFFAMIGNRFLNWLMMYDVEVGLATPKQVSAAIVILGLLQPVLEESLKAFPLICAFLIVRRCFAGIADGMLYAAAVGLGFGMAENYQYIYRAGIQSGMQVVAAVVVVRSVVFGLVHTVWSTPLGIGLGIAGKAKSRVVALLVPCSCFVLGILIHGLHNASFLWAGLGRSYGAFAVVSSLAIYGFAYVAWMVLAFRSARQSNFDRVSKFA